MPSINDLTSKLPDPSLPPKSDETALLQGQTTQFATISGSGVDDIHVHAGTQGFDDTPPKRKHTALIVTVVVLLVLIAGSYGAGAYYFSNHFYPNSELAGVTVSLLSSEDAQDAVNSNWKNYSLSITGTDFSWTYTPDAAASIVDAKEAVSAALDAQVSWAWPMGLANALNEAQPETSDEAEGFNLNRKVDTTLLSGAFDEASFKESVGAAVDAYNESRTGTFESEDAFDAETGAFSATAALKNQQLDKDNIIKFAELKLADLASSADISLIGDDAYKPLNGDKTKEDIEAACTAANDLLGVDVTLKMNGKDAAKIDGSTVAQWINFDMDLIPSLNENALNTFANELAESFNTVGSTRTWTRADGKQCSVSGGSYGWTVDTAATVQAIIDAINNKQTGDIELSLSSSAATYTAKGEPDWGNRYIDCDISEQHVRMYDDSGNLIWESDCVTGDTVEDDHYTPTGVYVLNNNRASGDVELKGKIDPETNEPEYISHVSYWMPFIGNLVAFHDASWRSRFGGTIYQGNGSHGCVNLPSDKAAELFNLCKIGDVVVVHD